MPLIFAALVLAAFFVWHRRSNELFYLSVRDGRVLVVRGRIPAGLLSDFKDVLRGATRASVRIELTERGGRLTATELDEGTTQRLRNIFNLCPQSMLRSAPAIANPTLGQIVGIASLAWLLSR